ncbi:MAG: hypothetical protein PHH75_07445 [Candidatus Omnitrophica bacterium]|nr:hypothetical protein [Candidatus Omnitrophota bacterium]MDD5574993.1 hypothetical protein [Candidatus Omnitrophota bacterium]
MKGMRIFLPAALFLLCLCLSPAAAPAQEWDTFKVDHFIIFHQDEESFARKVGEKAERYYNSIAHDMGYARYSKFWSWENRVKIYIYPDKAEYLKNTNSPEWTEGLADYKNRSIASYAGSENFTDNVLPHEIAHLIFRDFVGFKGDIPLWLDEGIAQWWTTSQKNQLIQNSAKKLYERDAILSLDDITNFNIQDIGNFRYVKKVQTKDGSTAILILSPEQLINTFYLQAASLVGFMRERYGQDRFARFCRDLRDEKPLEKALQSAYAEYFKDLKGLEKAWRAYLAK